MPWRTKVDIYRDFPIAGSGADVALSPTLVGNSGVVGIVNFTRFNFAEDILTESSLISGKLRLRLRNVDKLYSGKFSF